MRLNAFLARAGVASRRGADKLIKAGKVAVNGHPGQLNTEVSNNDSVAVDGKPVLKQKLRYILLYKPDRVVTTLNDPQNRPKAIDLIDISERVVPVGRLDFDTTGVLLVTNDGELTHKLMHPSFKVDKVYQAEVEGRVTDEKIRKLEKGIQLEDGKISPAKSRKLAENKIELTIHEGRKHQVKRMLAAVGLPVKKLHRSKSGPLNLTGLKPSQWRDLTPVEVDRLKYP